jgi:hypothetical protein
MNEVLKAALKDWRSLHKVLTTFREDQVKAMLDYEIAGEARVSILERLHQRYNTLRVSRERVELLGKGRHI